MKEIPGSVIIPTRFDPDVGSRGHKTFAGQSQ